MNRFLALVKKSIRLIMPSKKELIFMSVVLLSFSMIFVGGIFNSQTKVEQISSEISKEVKTNNEAHLFCQSEKEKMTSNEQFSKYVNDQFYEVSPFKNVIGYNLDKTISCSIEELGDLGINPSFLVSTYFTNHEDTNHNIIFDRYYFGLVYKSTNTDRSAGFDNFAYITKTQADYLINNNSSFESYDDVINSGLTLTIAGHDPVRWKIANIIDDSYLFCDISRSVFNNYLLCFTLVPDSLKESESMLFSMSDSNYLNIDYISLIETYFSVDNYVFYVNSNDENNQPVAKLASLLNNRKNNVLSNVVSILIFVFFIAPFFVLAFFALKEKQIYTKHIIEFVFVSATVWLIFFIINKLSNSILAFSFVSLVLFFSVFLVFFFFLLSLWLVKKYGKRNTII